MMDVIKVDENTVRIDTTVPESVSSVFLKRDCLLERQDALQKELSDIQNYLFVMNSK